MDSIHRVRGWHSCTRRPSHCAYGRESDCLWQVRSGPERGICTQTLGVRTFKTFNILALCWHCDFIYESPGYDLKTIQ